jgi:hypothetical protein
MVRTRFARQPAALLIFDLDRFKNINDNIGHGAGDSVLTAFCQLATSLLRPTDLFGRIGGEEFASLLPDTAREDALWLAECAPRSKPPPTRPQSDRLSQRPALASQSRTMRVLISPLCWTRQTGRSIAPRRWVAIVSSCRRIWPHCGRRSQAPFFPRRDRASPAKIRCSAQCAGCCSVRPEVPWYRVLRWPARRRDGPQCDSARPLIASGLF